MGSGKAFLFMPENRYAETYAYYTISNNMGYEGDLELAMVPESFRTEILKETLDENIVAHVHERNDQPPG